MSTSSTEILQGRPRRSGLLLVCVLARLYGYPLDPRVYLIGELPVRIAPLEVIAVAGATLAICFLSTLYPSMRASRLRAVEGLRYD